MGIIETQLKHVGYELDMLVYTFDKLLLVELGDCRMASEKPATVLSEIAPRTELLGAVGEGCGAAGQCGGRSSSQMTR
jgi:hypothetical protein